MLEIPVPFRDWWERVLRLDDELAALAVDESKPAGPDHERIERSTIETHLRIWNTPS